MFDFSMGEGSNFIRSGIHDEVEECLWVTLTTEVEEELDILNEIMRCSLNDSRVEDQLVQQRNL